MSGRWASLEGWTPDPSLPGFLRSEEAEDSWRRTTDGRWWSRDDIDAARAVVDEAGQIVRLELDARQHRLEVTPADKAANESPASWRTAVEAFKRERTS